MKKKRLLFICLLTSFFCYAKAETSVWDGSSYSFDWYTSGSGAIYHIKTAADLAGLSRCFSTGYYLHGDFKGRTIILDNDIDLDGHEWTPIGFVDANYTSFEFAGIFDGNNHTIKGMSITKHNNNNIHVGLFGHNYSNSFQVKNLRVEGDINLNNITGIYDGGSVYAGGIVGYTCASAIENCQSNVNITITLDNGNFIKAICGGIVGNIQQSNIVDLCKNCFSKGNINVILNNSNEASVGGLIGESTCATAVISSCASQSNIKIANGRSSYAGGIAGHADFSRMENALFAGTINLEYPNYGLAGGMMGGDRTTPSYYKYCLVTGNITKTYGTAWYSPFVGSAFEGSTGDNCYYLSGIPNSRNFGKEISDTELKSGDPISGFDTSIWDFTEGCYPTLQFLKAFPETPKCATPTISYDNGKLQFSCETEGVEYVAKVTCTATGEGEYGASSIPLTTTYKVTVYATKKGYENSDVATKDIDVSGTSSIRGDLNGDGIVSMPDAMFIVNKMLNGKFPDEEEPMTYYYYAGWTLPTESNIETIINETLPENSGSSTLNNCGKKTTSKSSMDFSSNALYNVNGRDYYYVLVPEGQTIVDTENVDITENYTSQGTITIGNQSHVIYKSNMTTRYINDITIY